MDRAPRRRADKSKRGRRAAGRSEPTPAYVEPTSSEALAYDQWAEDDWAGYQHTGQPYGDPSYGEQTDDRGNDQGWNDGWADQTWYDDRRSPAEPPPTPGGGRRIASGRSESQEPDEPNGYTGKRARITPEEPEPAYGGYPAPAYRNEPAPALSGPTAPPPSARQAPAYSTGTYGRTGLAQAPHTPSHIQQPGYQPDSYQQDTYQPESYQPDPYQPYGTDPYQADVYQSGQVETIQDPAAPYEPETAGRPKTAAKVTSFLAQPRVPGAGAARAGLGLIESLTSGTIRLIWIVALAVGLVGLAISAFDLGPEIFGGLGAAVVGTAYTFALAHRTGGRPLIFGALAGVAGIVVVLVDNEALRTGAAVLVASVAAVLAVMGTVPSRRFPKTIREAFIAVGIAALGSFAALGFEPVVMVSRFEYATLACSLAIAFFAVYRLGAGLHGLGRRGAIVVGIGGLMLALTLIYAEMLRRYGSTGLLDSVGDMQRWCRIHIGGYPHPIQAFFGVPALVWGTHMRARRRQGWWVCLFGVALTAPVASTFLNPDVGLLEAGLSVVYSILVGLVIAFVIIRIDLALTGSTAGGGRRAAREADEASAVRPEPSRTRSLL
ncbi:hypothetical protein J2S40_003929 [Nocardioides luteus]|uniref:DUF4401 domain-containing protein n=1 Tax=Nocardioides luteus TaxID=1844 RepID=A0ABQ5SYL1_9ACTN|nr:hypothetical protein [Nocardioides luteus]MDR7312871.1 hypothetical protein [Nocardioides luteus]GGR48168.1 hypothetical protein GCM10010197_12610 [Nocardioides luteus]GLJ69125.1 hypothetical protein GCM10017579_31610 [Nocardioides luteus]